jgi:hypothetical protein
MSTVPNTISFRSGRIEPMMKHQVRTVDQAFAFITDCLLATVAQQAMLKSRRKYTFDRHINIAQTACDWLRDMGVDPIGTRAADVIGNGLTVREWAEQYMPEYQTKENSNGR